MHRNAPGRRAGFTIIELLLVMTVIGILVTIALPRVDFVGMAVDSGFRQAAMTIMAAQRQAVLKQHAIVVALDTTNKLLRIHEDRNNDGLITTGEQVSWSQLEEGVVFGRGSAPASSMGSSAVTFVKKQNGLPAITFHRSGSAGEMGGFYLTSARGGSSPKYASDARAIQIERATGRTTLLQYAGGKWIRRF